jgi:hypothetical protein
MIAAHVFAYLSIAVGLAAAGLWFWASRVEVPTVLVALYGGGMAGLPEMRAGLARVARLNQWAALATALAAVLQALAQSVAP